MVQLLKVTNTGSVAGKDVVELYYTAPTGTLGIEKSYVVLGGFAKTQEIQPGASDVVTITMHVDDMASYDYANNGCYVLEAGTYELKLQTDAHSMKNGVDVIEYVIDQTVIYNDSHDGAKSTDRIAAVNHFDYADISNSTADAYGTYLSGTDWTSTWPTNKDSYTWETYTGKTSKMPSGTYWAYTAKAPADVIEAANNHYDMNSDPNVSKYWSSESITTNTPYPYANFPEKYKAENRSSSSSNVVFSDMMAVPYDDEETWDLFLGQLSMDELTAIYNDGGYGTPEIASIEKTISRDYDGPAGFAPFMYAYELDANYYPSATLLGCTWNVELAEQMGQSVGSEAKNIGFTGWYAPGVNIHRTPFGGRNNEYFSEDGLLSGKMSAAVVTGAREMGLLCWVKHMALNDQETNRDINGIFTYSNEQAIREIYLRPFEIVVKEGNCNGIMSSFNRIGTIWAGANGDLQIDVLRNEWGYEGATITDFYTLDNLEMVTRAGLFGGNDNLLSGMGLSFGGDFITASEASDSPEMQQALKAAAKHILYAYSRSELVTIEKNLFWRKIWVAADVVLAAGIALMAVAIVKDARKKEH